MITLTLKLEVDENKFTQCITSAWEKNFEEKINPKDIKPFVIGDVVTNTDVRNMLLGSCLGELVDEDNSEMIRIL